MCAILEVIFRPSAVIRLVLQVSAATLNMASLCWTCLSACMIELAASWKAEHLPASRRKARLYSQRCAYLLFIVHGNDRPDRHKNEVISLGAPACRAAHVADEPQICWGMTVPKRCPSLCTYFGRHRWGQCTALSRSAPRRLPRGGLRIPSQAARRKGGLRRAERVAPDSRIRDLGVLRGTFSGTGFSRAPRTSCLKMSSG